MSEISLILRYVGKYAPSLTRLKEYAMRKGLSDIDTTVQEIGFDEIVFCELWIRSYIALGRPKRDIETRLLKKKFLKETIQKGIDLYKDALCNWQEYESKIILLIQKYQRSGKSNRLIEAELISKYPYFREEIKEILSHKINDENLLVHKDRILSKYNLSVLGDKKKALDFLIRKGFPYKDALSFLQAIHHS